MLTPGQVANGAASAVTAVTGLTFVTSYALAARWWKTLEGRLMMMLTVAITSTCLLTLTLTLGGFKDDDDWLRIVQATLMFSIGSCFAYYTFMVWRTQKRGMNKK